MAKLKLPRLPRLPQKFKPFTKTTLDKPVVLDVFDEDAVFKEFITYFFQDVIALLMPKLYIAVDWRVAPEFLEQQVINSTRGRMRAKGKRNDVDKLVKLRLLTGEDQFIFVHNEVQNQLTDALARRWFYYRSLIFILYDIDDITTLVIYSGKAPQKKHKVYRHDCFGTTVIHRFNSYAIANQSVKKLIASDNPVAIAILAAKYTLETENDARKRLIFKKKMFELAQKKNLPDDKMQVLLNFVLDYMVLPREMEEEFKAEIPIFSPVKSNNMIVTQNRIDLADALSLAKYGMNWSDYVDFREAQAAAKDIEVATAQAAAQAAAQAIKQRDEKAILGMSAINLPVQQIAVALGVSVSYVQEVLKSKPV